MVNLFEKYNTAGPRYTSYPTVPYWEETPTAEQWTSSLKRTLEHENAGAAVYVHVPFCQSLCTYCGCNTRITRNRSVGMPYVQTVLREWAIVRKVKPIIAVKEVHFGGGTPTFLEPDELRALIVGLKEGMKILPHAEFSIEADPRVTTREHLEVLAEQGFTRLSLGIQDFDPKVQEAVHRVQSVEQVQKVVQDARSLGFKSVNFDLIYGLPFQTLESIAGTLESVKALRPDRIAFYAYAHVPWIKPSQRRFTEADLPEGAEKRALYELGREKLEALGYQEIGMDHFALPEDTLSKSAAGGRLHRNFMGYMSDRVHPLIGLGVSAIGDSGDAFVQNEKVLEKYQERVEKGELPIFRGHLLNQEDLVLREHILNLMTAYKTDWKSNDRDIPYLVGIEARLESMAKDGLVEIGDREISVPPRGRPFLRNLCMVFDARLARKATSGPLFSKTV